jgi:hypothetical protein
MVSRTPLLLGLAAIVGIQSSAVAQSRKSLIGVVAGVNFARLTGAGVVDAKTRTSAVGGLFSRNDFSRNLGFETQLLWSEQGAKGEVSGVTGTVKLSYLKIPVLFTAAVPTSNARLTPRFYLGPTVSFRTGCKLAAGILGLSTSVDCSDADVETKKTDFSILGGVGLDVGPVTVAARYDYGLTKVDDSPLNLDVKNRVFSIVASAGIRIP